MRIWRSFIMVLLSVAAIVGPAYSTQHSPEERQSRNLEILKSEQYYEFMDGVDNLISDGLGFSESAFEQLNDLFRILKQQDPDRFELIRSKYREVFDNLDIE